jgi:ABC-type bacteriocin/lantibiotic exporter with double-glycine peptidase domain
MVLAYYDHQKTEQQLVEILGTQSFGGPISRVSQLQKWGFSVIYHSLTIAELKKHLDQRTPVIAWVWTAMLTYANKATSHVVVVTGCDDTTVFLHDPAMSTAPQMVVWDSFLAAWAEYDEKAVIIVPA